MFAELFKPLDVSDDALGLEAIADVGPGGHFFGTQHTIDRFENAFYSPLLSDWSNFENWQDRGSLDTTKRANLIYKDIIENFEPPKMDQATIEELDAFIARREEEGGADISR